MLAFNLFQKGDLMFRQINGHKTDITIFIDEKPTNASSGETVAAVLLRENIYAVHTTPNGEARGPYCMMGVCFDCMVTLENGQSEQACQIDATEGLKIYLPISDRYKVGK